MTHPAIMDRNLGALASNAESSPKETWGLCYQKGRKDPFPNEKMPTYSATGKTKSVHGTVDYSLNTNLSYITKKPTIAIKSSSEFIYPENNHNYRNSSNWYNPTWNTDEEGKPKKKSLFDPCPVGWYVPTHDFLTTIVNKGAYQRNNLVTNGFLIYLSGIKIAGSETAFYPSGYCRYQGGSWYDHTIMWPSDCGSGLSAIWMQSGGSTISLNSAYPYSSHGSIRCIQEVK